LQQLSSELSYRRSKSRDPRAVVTRDATRKAPSQAAAKLTAPCFSFVDALVPTGWPCLYYYIVVHYIRPPVTLTRTQAKRTHIKMPNASRNLPPASVHRLLSELSTARVLDVRTPGEFESGHIRGAYNVPLDTVAEHAREIGAASGAPIVLVCQSGQRANKADDALRAVGMSNLYILDGGMNAWTSARLDVVHLRKRISLERQVRIAAGALAATGGFLALLVNPLFAAVPAVIGSGLVFAGVTDTCAMGMLLARLPYNRAASCDPAAVIRALASANGNGQAQSAST